METILSQGRNYPDKRAATSLCTIFAPGQSCHSFFCPKLPQSFRLELSWSFFQYLLRQLLWQHLLQKHWTELISMLLTSMGSHWRSQWCRVLRVVVSNTSLTLTNSTDVSAIIFHPIWVTEAYIVLEAEEGTSSTIRAVVPIFLSRVEIAGRWSHRRGWSWWSAASSSLTSLY